MVAVRVLLPILREMVFVDRLLFASKGLKGHHERDDASCCIQAVYPWCDVHDEEAVFSVIKDCALASITCLGTESSRLTLLI